MELNMYEWIRDRKQHLPDIKIKRFTFQLLKSLEHMHSNGIFHRDIKPENILLAGDLLKLADFGSCRGIHSKQPYTEYISTRWYRSPECLMTDGFYDFKMDLWGVGCVLFEIQALFPLFPGKNELDQIHKIHKILGTPPQSKFDEFKKHASHMEIKFSQQSGSGIDRLIPHVSEPCKDLIKKLLTYDSSSRLTCQQALSHVYFKDIKDPNIHTRSTQSLHSNDDVFDKMVPEVLLKNPSTKKKSKKFLPLIKKIVKNPSLSKCTLGLDRSPLGSKVHFPSMKTQISPYGQKSSFKVR
jgi:renal tumor antigen